MLAVMRELGIIDLPLLGAVQMDGLRLVVPRAPERDPAVVERDRLAEALEGRTRDAVPVAESRHAIADLDDRHQRGRARGGGAEAALALRDGVEVDAAVMRIALVVDAHEGHLAVVGRRRADHLEARLALEHERHRDVGLVGDDLDHRIERRLEVAHVEAFGVVLVVEGRVRPRAPRALERDPAAAAHRGHAGEALERGAIRFIGHRELGEVRLERVGIAHVAEHVRRGVAVAVGSREDARGALEELLAVGKEEAPHRGGGAAAGGHHRIGVDAREPREVAVSGELAAERGALDVVRRRGVATAHEHRLERLFRRAHAAQVHAGQRVRHIARGAAEDDRAAAVDRRCGEPVERLVAVGHQVVAVDDGLPGLERGDWTGLREREGARDDRQRNGPCEGKRLPLHLGFSERC